MHTEEYQMNKRRLAAAWGLTTAAVILGAETVSNYILYTSVYMPKKDKNTFPEDTNMKHHDNPEIKTVFINSFDGTQLLGHWYPCENAVRNVVCMHGWHGSWLKDFGDIIDFLHDSGCNVLLADERAQNGSEGRYMGFSLLERYDCLEWIKWISAETSQDLPVYIYGVSMGSATVMMTAGMDLPENVKGVIADCGFTSPKDIWTYLLHKNMHLPYGKLLNLMIKVKFALRTGERDVSYSTIESLKNCDLPVLFVHGSEDDFVPTEMSYRNYEAFEGDKELLIIKGAGHAVNYRTDPAAYEAAVKRLWEKCEK